MKFILLLLLLATGVCGSSGVSITPVVVVVENSKGEVLTGATVTVEKSLLQSYIRNPITEDFGRFAKKASKQRVTNNLGMALVYFGTKFLSDGKGGKSSLISGNIVVTADGYDKKTEKIEKEIYNKSEGRFGKIIQITLVLKRSGEGSVKAPR